MHVSCTRSRSSTSSGYIRKLVYVVRTDPQIRVACDESPRRIESSKLTELGSTICAGPSDPTAAATVESCARARAAARADRTQRQRGATIRGPGPRRARASPQVIVADYHGTVARKRASATQAPRDGAPQSGAAAKKQTKARPCVLASPVPPTVSARPATGRVAQ